MFHPFTCFPYFSRFPLIAPTYFDVFPHFFMEYLQLHLVFFISFYSISSDYWANSSDKFFILYFFLSSRWVLIHHSPYLFYVIPTFSHPFKQTHQSVYSEKTYIFVQIINILSISILPRHFSCSLPFLPFPSLLYHSRFTFAFTRESHYQRRSPRCCTLNPFAPFPLFPLKNFRDSPSSHPLRSLRARGSANTTARVRMREDGRPTRRK